MNTKDEEKAYILSREQAQEYDYKESVGYACAMEMAAWKDKQTILFLEKIEREAVDTTTANYLKKAIEDFKKYIKGE